GYIWQDRLIEYVPDGKFYVNNELHGKRPRPVDQIIQDAEANAWKKYTYNLEKMNCEHFATRLRYGTAICTQVITNNILFLQVDKLKTAVAAGAVGAAVGASGVPVAPVVAGSLISRALSWFWYSSSSSSSSSNQQYFVFAGKESGGSSS
ncbi:phospholipase A and acyltransferase 1-like, partial [Huso huso]